MLAALTSSAAHTLVVRIAPIFRIHQAIARDYGATLPRRYARLLKRLGDRLPPGAAAPPKTATLIEFVLPTDPRTAPKLTLSEPFIEPIPSHVGNEGPPTAPGGEPARLAATSAEAPLPAPATLAEPPSWERSVEPVTQSRAISVGGPPSVAPATPASASPASASPATSTPTAPASAPPAPASAPPAPASAPPASASPTPTVRASGFPSSFLSGDARAHSRVAQRRRGPLTFAVAKKEIDEADGRDAVLDLVFEFSRQFFEFSAIFVAHGDLAEGRDAAGNGASRDKVAGLGVPLEGRSVLSTARATLLPVFAMPEADGLDAVLMRDLERAGKSTVAVIPIVVRRRLVALFLGDDGEAHVEATSVQEVTSFAALAGAAFERLIVRRKRDGRPTGAPTGAPSAAPSASAPPVELPSPAPNPVPQFAANPEPRTPTIEWAGPASSEPSCEPATAAAPEPATAADPPSAFDDGDRSTLVDPPSFGAQRLAISPRPMVDAPAVEPPASSRPPALESSPPPTMRRGRDSHPADPGRTGVSLSEPSLPTSQLPEVVIPPSAAIPAPLPSERVSVGARKPPTRSDLPTGLPSVIVDVGSEYTALIDRVMLGDEEAETQLLHAGQHAMPAILVRFPGTLTVDLAAPPPAGLPRASECGNLLRLVAKQRRVALPYLLTVVDERDVDRRFWATYLLSELPYIESIEPAVSALFDPEPRVRGAARVAVRVLGELYPTFTVERLARGLADPRHDAGRKVIAIQLLGELREAASVPHLLPCLVDPQPEVATTARASLMLVTRQDFGLHIAHWTEWHAANASRQRVEWLIDALEHPAAGLRAAALEELQKLTRNTFGFREEMNKRERERVLQRFRDWWAVEGRARFGR